MGFSDSRDQIGTRIELFPEEIRSESGQLSGVVDIEAGTRADDLEAPCFQAEMDLQLAEEKRHLDRLRSRVCVNLVQHEEPQTSIVKEWSVARQEQQVLQHRVVCDENMRGRLQHFRAREQPGPWEARNRRCQPQSVPQSVVVEKASLLHAPVRSCPDLARETTEGNARVLELPEQQGGQPEIELIVGEGVQRIYDHRPDAGLRQVTVT